MVHCNNCTSDLNAWVDLLAQAAALGGTAPDKGALFTKLFELSLQGAPDAGGIVPVNYYSGEGVTHFDAGCPLLLRGPESAFTLPNLMRAHIYSAMATLALGLDILHGEEVAVDTLTGHGGLFKTPGVAQRYLAAAAAAPVTVRQTAGEGGPYGMALLAAYALNKAPGETLAAYLHERVFAGAPASTLAPTEADRAGVHGVPGPLPRRAASRTRRPASRKPGLSSVFPVYPTTQGGIRMLDQTALKKIDAYWRASNYLAAGQLYLLDNPLLRRPLTRDDVKKKIVGHWGTVPGQNFVYVHLNRVIKKYDQDMILISGPGPRRQLLCCQRLPGRHLQRSVPQHQP